MKKTLLIFSLMLFCTATFAQVSGGFKIGLNAFSQKWSYDGASKSYTGTNFHAGGFLNFKVNETFSVQPEMLYNSCKYSLEGTDFTLNYLSIPVMFLYELSDGKFNIQAGPQVGFMLSTDPSEIKDSKLFTTSDFTLNLGAGANIDRVTITLRYGVGLANVVGSELKNQVGSGLSVKNNNLQISLGIKVFGE